MHKTVLYLNLTCYPCCSEWWWLHLGHVNVLQDVTAETQGTGVMQFALRNQLGYSPCIAANISIFSNACAVKRQLQSNFRSQQVIHKKRFTMECVEGFILSRSQHGQWGEINGVSLACQSVALCYSSCFGYWCHVFTLWNQDWNRVISHCRNERIVGSKSWSWLCGRMKNVIL